jgi:hypothetical protein
MFIMDRSRLQPQRLHDSNSINTAAFDDDNDDDFLMPISGDGGAISSSISTARSEETRLPDDFVPNAYTILCGRGKQNTGSVGNRRLRIFIIMYLEKYTNATSKVGKSVIVTTIMDIINQANGKFVRNIDGTWWEIGEAAAREKVGAMFRDLLYTKYRSASKSKVLQRRRNDQRQQRRRHNVMNTVQPLSASFTAGDMQASYHADPISRFDFEPIPLQRSQSDVTFNQLAVARNDSFSHGLERGSSPISLDCPKSIDNMKLKNDMP